MQLRWIEQLLQEFIIPRRWEYSDCRFLWEVMERGGSVTWTGSQTRVFSIVWSPGVLIRSGDCAIVEVNHKSPPHHRLPDLPLRSERTEAVEMQWGILGNDRTVGNTVGVSLTLEPRSPQTSSNKSRKNISASGHVCVKWNTQTKQWKCWQKIRSWLKILHKSRWLVYGITTALNPSLTLSVFHVLSPISCWFFST